MNTVARVEDLPRVPSREVDGPILWIDDATGKIVDHSSRSKSGREVDEVPPQVAVATSRRSLHEESPVFMDLVGPRPPVMIEDGRRGKRTRLSLRLVPLLPARGGGS